MPFMTDPPKWLDLTPCVPCVEIDGKRYVTEQDFCKVREALGGEWVKLSRDNANLCQLVEKATWLIRDLTCDEPRTPESNALDFAYHAERELQRILGLVQEPAEEDNDQVAVYLDPKDWTPGRLLAIDLHILYALIEQNQEIVREKLASMVEEAT